MAETLDMRLGAPLLISEISMSQQLSESRPRIMSKADVVQRESKGRISFTANIRVEFEMLPPAI